MYDRELSKYDESGVLKDEQSPSLLVGDHVEYIDAKHVRRKLTKIKLHGVWNGEYVRFNDKERTLVRNIRWLRKMDEDEVIKCHKVKKFI